MIKKTKIVIIGGGITGLTAAFYAKQNPDAEVVLIERTNRVGGWIRTVQKEGYLFEMGPRSCRASGTGLATLELIKDLGIEDEVITAPPDAFKRYLYADQKLRPLPQSPLQLLTQPWYWQFIPSILKEPFVKRGTVKEESIEDFFTRRFSKKVAETFVDPMVSGVFAGDMKQLSLASCFPAFAEWEQEHGSLLKAMMKHKPFLHQDPFIRKVQQVGLFSFKQGMETLVHALASQLKENIILNTEVTALNNRTVSTSNGDYEADQVVCTHPLSIEIPKASIAIVNFGFRQSVMKQKGFGYLIPRKENSPILGAIWDSFAFPQQNASLEMTRLSFMLGGSRMEDFADYSEQYFIDRALEGLKQHLQIDTPPDFVDCNILHKAIPQYVLGHKKRAHNVTEIGSHYTGVSVNDCITTAKRAVLKNNAF